MHPKIQVISRDDVGSSRSTLFIKFFHMGAFFCFFPVILISSTDPEKNNQSLFSVNRQTFPIRYFFPSTSNRTSSNCLSHNRPANGCLYKFRSRRTTPLRCSLLTSCSRLRVGSRNSWSLPDILAVPSAFGKMKSSRILWRQYIYCIDSSKMDFQCVHIFIPLCLRPNVSFPNFSTR